MSVSQTCSQAVEGAWAACDCRLTPCSTACVLLLLLLLQVVLVLVLLLLVLLHPIAAKHAWQSKAQRYAQQAQQHAAAAQPAY